MFENNETSKSSVLKVHKLHGPKRYQAKQASRQPDRTLDPKKMKENRNIILNQTHTEMIIMHELSARTVLYVI